MPKRATGVHVRAGSNVWQWRLKTPKDLRHLYPSEWAHRCSLGTTLLIEANTRAVRLHADWLATFNRQRLLHVAPDPRTVEAITPEMAQSFAARMLHDALALDERRRSEPDEQAWLLHWMRGIGMPGADVAPEKLSGMPEAHPTCWMH